MLSLITSTAGQTLRMEKMKKTNLTYENRLIIENGIEKRLSFASIAKQTGKDRSTISREVKRNRTYDYQVPLSEGRLQDESLLRHLYQEGLSWLPEDLRCPMPLL